MFEDKIVTSGIFFGIISMLGWGIGDFAIALASRKVGILKSLFYNYLVGSFFLIIFFYFVKLPFTVTSTSFILSFIGGVLHLFAAFFFYKGLRVGKISLVSPIASSYSLVIVLAAIIFIKETLSLIQLVAIGQIIIGNFLISANIKDLILHTKFKKNDPGIPYAFLTMFMWGIGFLFINQAVKISGPFIPNLILYITGLVLFSFYIFIKNVPVSINLERSTLTYILVNGAGSALAYTCYSLGIGKNLASVISPIASSFPLITVSLSLVLLKERISIGQFVGILLTMAGIIILSL